VGIERVSESPYYALYVMISFLLFHFSIYTIVASGIIVGKKTK
jgi:hypothetical protein